MGSVLIVRGSPEVDTILSADDALRQGEERYRLLVESIPALVWVFDAAGQTVLHNRRWYDYTGRSPEDGGADHWHELLYPDDAPAAIASWEISKASGEPYSHEYRLRRADGVYRWFLSRKTARRGTDGSVEQWVGICTDIDDRKKAEQALRQTSEMLSAVTEGTDDAIFVKDRNSKYLMFNAAAARFVGRPIKDVLGLDDTELFDAMGAGQTMAQVSRIVETGKAESNEQILTAGGVTRVYQATQAPYRNDRGDIVGVIGIAHDITERKRAEDNTKQSRALLKVACRIGRMGAWAVKLPDFAVVWSDEVRAIYGLPPETNLGIEEGLDFYTPEHRDTVRAAVAACARDGTPFDTEVQIDTVQGQRLWVRLIGEASRDATGTITLLQGALQDISYRKRAEDDLRTSENQLRQQSRILQSVLDNMGEGVVVADEHGKFVLFNPAAEQMLRLGETGTRPEEWSQRYNLYLPDGVSPFPTDRIPLVKALRGEPSNDIEMIVNHHGIAEPHWLSVSARSIRDEDGVLRGGVAVMRDVTDRKRAEEALLLRDRAIGAASQGIIITDPNQIDNPLIYISPGFERMTGYCSKEALGRNCRFLQGKDTDRAVVAQLREAIRTRVSCTVELLNYRKDGTPFWNELSISPVHNTDGSDGHFVGILTDVTPRRCLEEQFHQAQKMEGVGQLAGGIAHDFNNLLTIINGYSELLLERLPENDPSRELIDEIHKAGERSAGLTRQLLAFSRQQVLSPQTLDLNSVLASTEKMLRRLIGEDVLLTAKLQPGLWAVRADAGQIEQVLMNLALNARDAMRRGGKLTIETQNIELDEAYAGTQQDARSGPHVLLSMTDTGTGIPPAVKARIFEPFFTTKGAGKGTGLGLATVYGIVRQSGGHIAVYSEVGIGTSFKIYLPRVERVMTGSKPEITLVGPQRGTETILLAEDESAVRSLIRHVLIGCGYVVLEATDGTDAVRLATASTGLIHLLITDVVMPGAGGRAVAEEIVERHPETRVLFVSGYTDDAVIRHGVLREGVNFLQKPFSPNALANKVREVLDLAPK